jgi:hypothetical protein
MPAAEGAEPATGSLPPEIDPGWIQNLAPGEFCGTQQRYVAELIAEGKDPLAAMCVGPGACDDPATRDASIPSDTTPIKTYRLLFNVFCNNDGTNCAATQADIDNMVTILNADFEPWRIQFVYTTRFINNTKYRVLTGNEEEQMKRRYALSPATQLNIYVTDPNGQPGGASWAYFPWGSGALTWRGGIVLDESHVVYPYHVYTHEVGHCLGLWHTQHGVSEVEPCTDCYEPAGRPPEVGDVTGDFCSDTAPTPTNGTCVDPGGTDVCSGLPWGATPLTNHMGYSHSCKEEFTDQQAGRMHCWTEAVLTGWLQ